MATRIGYLLPTRESVMEGRPEVRPLLELATRAEALGYDSIWVGEHLLYRFADRGPRGPWEAWTLMAAIAGVDSDEPSPDHSEATSSLTVTGVDGSSVSSSISRKAV